MGVSKERKALYESLSLSYNTRFGKHSELENDIIKTFQLLLL